MRGLLAALVPSPRSLPALLPQLISWEDHLWARISMLLSEKINHELDSLAGSFWLSKIGKGGPQRLSVPLPVTPGRNRPGTQDWDTEIRKVLAEMEVVKVDG